MKKVFKIIGITIAVLTIIFLFNEMFFMTTVSSNIKFKQLTHYENRADILTFVNIIVTSVISLVVYNLSKKINEQNNIEKSSKKYKSICDVYDYLNEIIRFIKKKVFNDKEDYCDLIYQDDFMQEVYNLNNYVLNEEDIKTIRELDRTLKNYLSVKGENSNSKLAIKWVYKNIFDLNMKINDIEKINDLTDIDMLLSVSIVNILTKLRKALKYKYCKKINVKNIELNIEEKNKHIVVEKKYGNGQSLKNGNWFVKVYEPVFYIGNPLYRDGGIIYEGYFNNYKPNGEGIYNYYKSDEKKIFINSDDLIDNNAKKIKRMLQNLELEVRTNAVIKGEFEDGIIVKGSIKSLEGKFDDIEIKE